MMTKRQLCLTIVHDFALANGISASDVTENHIEQSSQLAVAMEYLGRLHSQENVNYAMGRGGVLFHYADKVDGKVEQAMLNLRELLVLLPD